jgi:3-methyladenine DNA glycosylase AlkD
VTRRAADQLAGRIARTLEAAGSAERAAREQAYLKSSRVHYGVPVPAIRATVREALAAAPLDHDLRLAAVAALWKTDVHELRMAAVELLVRSVKLLERGDLAVLERLLRESHTWALVDSIAAHLVGALVVAHPALARTLDRWARDPDFWIRRAAMLALLGPLRRGGGDFERFARYADAMLEEREFFIRKAIGWVLREVGRQRPALVAAWLLPRAGRASGVTVREAVKPLPAKQAAAILRAFRAGRRAPRQA